MLRFIAFFLCAFAWATAQAAPSIVTTQPLDFGTLAIKSNAAPSSVSLTPQGSASYGSGFVYVSAPKPGHYQLTGYPLYVDMTVSMAPTSVSLTSGLPGETLTATLATTNPQALHTDLNGSVAFTLGAILTTSGSGTPYQDGPYLGHADLTFSFIDLAGQPQFSHQTIDVHFTQRNSLVLTQVQPLNFGKLLAYSSNTDQASLTLGTNGLVTILRPGSARIVRFGGETPATIQVTTGAAYAPVSIVLPSTPVYLVHASQSATVARLVVTNFVAQPVTGNVALNALGAMNFRVGATLSTEQTTKSYQDGVYTGTYDVTVEY